MAMRFDGGGIGHKSTFTAAPPLVGPDGDAEADGIGSGMGNPGGGEEDGGTAGGLHLEDDAELPEEVDSGEEADYGYAGESEEEDEDGEDDEMDGCDLDGGGLGPEDGEEAFEDDVLELEGYAPL